MSDDFYDREYNPRLSVPNVGEYLERWQSGAKRVRDEVSARWDLSYGPSSEEILDYYPAKSASAPLLIFVHGGYWRALHKDDFSWVAPRFLENGVSVANVNYALAPGVGLGEIVAQIRRSVAWLHSNAGELGFDPERVVCCGHSAGGHLAAMLLATDWQAFGVSLTQPLCGVVAISGLFDLEPLMRASFLQGEIILSNREVHDLSPANLQPISGSRVLTMVGEKESNEFHRQNHLLAERWGASMVRGPLVIEQANHFDACDALTVQDGEVFQSTLSLFAQ